jgi:predicted DCC family thiol-disulfide oxidoreductase YuxK
MINGLYVLYDERCGLCTHLRAWFAQQPTLVPVRFVAAGSPEARELFGNEVGGAPPEELVVIDDQGGVYSDAQAWIMCLWAFEAYREWAERLSSPRLMPLARQVFAGLSRNRALISRIFLLRSDDEMATALRGVYVPQCSSQ